MVVGQVEVAGREQHAGPERGLLKQPLRHHLVNVDPERGHLYERVHPRVRAGHRRRPPGGATGRRSGGEGGQEAAASLLPIARPVIVIYSIAQRFFYIFMYMLIHTVMALTELRRFAQNCRNFYRMPRSTILFNA